MKKYIFPLFAAALSLVSCAKEPTVQDGRDDSWKYDESKPVPIEFSACSPSTKVYTKAMVNEFNNTPIGIVGAKPKWDDLSQSVWTPGERYSTILNNAQASIGSDRNVSFTDGEYYYPVFSDAYFSFYAYHPYSESASLNESGDAWSVKYDISAGQTDILWAESLAEQFNGVDGFNARYIRTLVENDEEGYRPVLDFKHLLASLEFKAKLAEGVTSSDCKVRKVSVVNTASRVELIIVDNRIDRSTGAESTTESGTLRTDLAGEVTVNPGTPVEPDAESVSVGSCMLLPQDSYDIVIYVSTSDEQTEEEWQVSAPLALTPTSPATTFEAGKKHIVNILFKQMENISGITATLDVWGEGTNNDLNTF